MPARKNRYSSGSYRRSRKLKKIKKFFKMFGLSITGLVLFSIAFYLYTLAINLKKPFASASNGIDYTEKKYDSTTSFNILIIELNDKEDLYSEINNLHLYHINPEDQSSVLFKLPLSKTVSYGTGLGEGRLDGIYKAGNYGSEKEGLDLVTKYIKKSLAVPVNGYIIYDVETGEELKSLGVSLESSDLPGSIKYTHVLKVSDLFDLSRNHLLSDLGSIEALKILSDTKSFNESYSHIELPEDIYKNSDEFDKIWDESTEITAIKRERISVTILNSTDTSGLAAWGSRTVKNAGALIKELGNSEGDYNENVIYTDLEDSETLEFLRLFHNVEKVLPAEQYEENPFLAKRSDILLILGKQSASDYK